MQLTSLALALVAAVSVVSAYPIKGDGVRCRSGPGTSYKIVKSYNKGADVKITCQAYGENISGDNIWDKTSDGCYVSDYYVKTGTTRLANTPICGSSSGGGSSSGSSAYNGKIKRSEVIARGQYWINRHVPYSMSKTYPDQQGRKYRTDCSGFVSMALHTLSPGYNTVSLLNVVKAISWSSIKPGDLVGTLGVGTNGNGGHVTLFLSWADSAHKHYHSLECRGTAYGCVAYTRAVGWGEAGHVAKPYRYIRIVD